VQTPIAFLNLEILTISLYTNPNVQLFEIYATSAIPIAFWTVNRIAFNDIKLKFNSPPPRLRALWHASEEKARHRTPEKHVVLEGT